jgi:hypothetical protein
MFMVDKQCATTRLTRERTDKSTCDTVFCFELEFTSSSSLLLSIIHYLCETTTQHRKLSSAFLWPLRLPLATNNETKMKERESKMY